MEKHELSREDLLEKIQTLEERLLEAEQTIEAIQSGEVDALVIHKPDGERLYTLTGADHGYRVLVESISEGALILSSDDSIYYCNRTLGEMLGIPIQKIVGGKLDPYVAPEGFPKLMELVRESRNLGAARGEFLMKRNGETLLPVNISLNYMGFEDFEGVCAIITDLSEQKRVEEELRQHRTELELLVKARTANLQQEIIEHKRTEEALRESEVFLRAVTEGSPDPIFVKDCESRIMLGNPALLRVWGKSIEDVVGKNDRELYEDPAIGEAIIANDRMVLQSGASQAVEEIVQTQDGLRTYLSTKTPYRNSNGEIVGILGIARDITERKQMEEQLRKSRDELEFRVRERTAELSQTVSRLQAMNQELQEFAFVASHDLQEPLRKIQAFGDILIRKHKESLNLEGQDYMDRITKAANRMSELLRALLSYSRTGTSQLNYKSVSLTEVAKDAANDLEFLIAKTKGMVEIGELPTVDADAPLLRQLFQNIIGNAIKYRKESEPPVVKIYGKIADATCRVCIEDNGIGLDECYSHKIFKPFERLHGRDAPYSGTGMGLAICRKIAARHGGSIEVRSMPGQGATFIVTLPAEQKTGA